jgi:DedD protein
MGISKSSNQPEYQMKHRLTGAAIMVVVAVMVIPILLKEPGIVASAGPGKNVTGSQQVFKSKIEPLNLDNANKLVTSPDNPGLDDEIKPALLDSNNDFSISTENTEIAAAGSKSRKSEEATKKDSVSVEPVVLTQDKNTKSESTKKAVPATPETFDGNSGWTVRVGTFSKIENVESVSALLNNSGFNAQHTKVQTTLGEATRVWLGPYEKKETAVKVSLRLKALTGEKGYVTKHTS